jgi:hypothetical protein
VVEVDDEVVVVTVVMEVDVTLDNVGVSVDDVEVVVGLVVAWVFVPIPGTIQRNSQSV